MIVRAIGLPGVVTSPSATSNKRSNSARQGLRTSSALRIYAVSFAVSDGSRRFTGSVSVATRRKIAFFVHGSWHFRVPVEEGSRAMTKYNYMFLGKVT